MFQLLFFVLQMRARYIMETQNFSHFMIDNKKLWDGVLVEVELSVSKANFATWFKDTYIQKQDDGVVYLSVPNTFVKTWLQDKFHKFILNSLRTHGENVRGLEYI